jgi:hypothetical protein
MRPFVFARIRATDEGRYASDQEGKWNVVVAVPDCFGEVCDLVAFDPVKPDNWLFRHGDETPILGADLLATAVETRGKVKVYPNPAEWLLSKRDGIVVLDWQAPLADLLRGVGQLTFDHLPPRVGRALADRIEKKLQAEVNMGLPRIGTMKKVVSRAA